MKYKILLLIACCIIIWQAVHIDALKAESAYLRDDATGLNEKLSQKNQELSDEVASCDNYVGLHTMPADTCKKGEKANFVWAEGQYDLQCIGADGITITEYNNNPKLVVEP